MKHAATGIRLRLWPGAHRHDSAPFALHAIWIGHRQPDFIRRARLEIEHAAGKHVGRNQIDARLGVDPFALQTEERQRRAPCLTALLAEGHINRGVPIRIALDEPLEPQIDQRGRLDDQFAGNDRVR